VKSLWTLEQLREFGPKFVPKKALAITAVEVNIILSFLISFLGFFIALNLIHNKKIKFLLH
jgi:hypothetical protein